MTHWVSYAFLAGGQFQGYMSPDNLAVGHWRHVTSWLMGASLTSRLDVTVNGVPNQSFHVCVSVCEVY